MDKLQPDNPLFIELASTDKDLLASQKLRYDVFAREQGVLLNSKIAIIDCDHYDKYCHHLLLREIRTKRVVGSIRILTSANARHTGGFHSERGFDLTKMLPNLKGGVIETGRACIHPDYRNGVGISMLWSGLTQFMKLRGIRYVFGCVSISMHEDESRISALAAHLREQYMAPRPLQVRPKVHLLPQTLLSGQFELPHIIQACLKLGAWVGGEPSPNPDTNMADFFILLDLDNLDARYHQHCIHSGKKTRYMKKETNMMIAA